MSRGFGVPVIDLFEPYAVFRHYYFTEVTKSVVVTTGTVNGLPGDFVRDGNVFKSFVAVIIEIDALRKMP